MALSPWGSRPHGCVQPGEQHAVPRTPQGSHACAHTLGTHTASAASRWPKPLCHTHSAGRQLCSGDGIAHIAVTFHVAAAIDVRVIGSMRAGDAEGGSEPTPPGGGTMTATHPHHPHKDWESGSATPSPQHHPCRRAEGGPRLHVAPPAPTPAAGRGGGGGDGGDVSALFPPGDSKQPFSKGHRMAPAVGHRGRGTGRGAPPAPCIGKAQGWQTGHCPPPLFMALHFPPETH